MTADTQRPAATSHDALRALEQCVGLCHATGARWADIYATASVAFAAAAGTPDPDAVRARLCGLLTAVVGAMEARR